MKNKIGLCLVSMFTPRVVAIKMPKIAHFFFYFCWWQQKISHVWEKYFSASERSFLRSFRKCYGLLDSELPLERCQPLIILGFGIFLLTHQFFYISIHDISRTVTPTPINGTILWKNARSFSFTKLFCPNCD